MLAFVCFVILLNCLAFILYGIDKRRAIRHQWRITERVLLSISMFSGVIGSIIGIIVFRHKTRKWYFWTFHMLAFILWGSIVYQIWLRFFTFHWN